MVADVFDGGPANVNDTLAGTAGDDQYHGGGGNDNLSTAAGDDLVSGDAGDDTISTGAGDDTITYSGTNEGFDSVTGGANVDEIIALTNNTTIGLRAISTVETISANGHTGVKILGSTLNDVLNFTAVTLIGIESIDGGGGNDALTGSAAADVIIGRAGTDTLNGGIGDDIIEGGAGNDAMNGGANNDVFRYLLGRIRCRHHRRLRCQRHWRSRPHRPPRAQHHGRQLRSQCHHRQCRRRCHPHHGCGPGHHSSDRRSGGGRHRHRLPGALNHTRSGMRSCPTPHPDQRTNVR